MNLPSGRASECWPRPLLLRHPPCSDPHSRPHQAQIPNKSPRTVEERFKRTRSGIAMQDPNCGGPVRRRRELTPSRLPHVNATTNTLILTTDHAQISMFKGACHKCTTVSTAEGLYCGLLTSNELRRATNSLRPRTRKNAETRSSS